MFNEMKQPHKLTIWISISARTDPAVSIISLIPDYYYRLSSPVFPFFSPLFIPNFIRAFGPPFSVILFPFYALVVLLLDVDNLFLNLCNQLNN